MPDKPIMNNYTEKHTARVTKMETLVYFLCNLVQFQMHVEIKRTQKDTSTWQQRTSLTVCAHVVFLVQVTKLHNVCLMLTYITTLRTAPSNSY